MLQVNEVTMIKYIFTAFIILFTTGCTQKEPIYSSKEYENINKDAVLNAAKRVLKLSDNKFSIDSKRNSINAIKIIPKNKGFTVDININKVEFIAIQDDNITKAKLKITHKEDFYSKQEKIILGAPHELFWQRLEYLLGLNKDWPTCFMNRVKLNFDGIFCDIFHNRNIYPTKKDIIQNINIYKPKPLNTKKKIELAKINLSILKDIKLPLVEDTKTSDENNSKMATIDTSQIFDLATATPSLVSIENNDSNTTEQNIINSIESNKTTSIEDNTSKSKIKQQKTIEQ